MMTVKFTAGDQELHATLVAWIRWLAHGQRASSHTLKAYQRDLAAFLEYLSARLGHPTRLTDLLRLDLTDFQAYCTACLDEEQAPASIARAISSLRNFFRFLEAEGFGQNAWIDQLAAPRIPKPSPITLSPEQGHQALELVSYLSDAPWIAKRDEALFALMYGSGLSLGETLALNYEQAPSGNTLTVGRSGKSRTVPVLSGVMTLIAEYLRLCPYPLAEGQPLFVGAKGRRLNPGVVQRQMRRLRQLLELPVNTTPQVLRQCFAQRLQAEGNDVAAIQKLLGHAHRVTTRRHLKN